MGGDSHDNDPRRWPDGVETYPAGDEVLAGYEKAREQLAQFSAPRLVGADKPHGRMFVACFDGTGNDKDKDPAHITNIGLFKDQIDAVNRQGVESVKANYQPGVGTQDEYFLQESDGALGYSYGPRMEQMYYDLCVQAKKWIKADPNAEISLAATGFSRGAVTAALFTRMVEERGIQDPEDMIIHRDDQGRVDRLTPTKPNLVPPGQTPQVVGLFDPVSTGMMDLVDVRLPPSVVSGFQITAMDERRDAFKSKQIIDPGLSPDGRFYAARVGGAHCDIGGFYLLNGLSVRNGNMMAAYLNSTSDNPFLRERPVPTAPEMNVIHRSEQHRAIYSTVAADLAGSRRSIERLTPPATTVAGAVYDRVFSNTDDAEPRNETLSRGLRFDKVRVGPEREDPSLPGFFKDKPRTPEPLPRVEWNQLFLNMTNAALDGDSRGIRMVGREFARSDAGQAWLAQGRESNHAVKLQEQQTALDTQQPVLAQQLMDDPVRRGPVMRI